MRNERHALVTGAGGFIGSHLVERLLKEGFSVVGIDNFLTGDRKNVDSLSQVEQYHFFEHDIITQFVSNDKFTHVFHLASPASPGDYQAHPVETALVNSIGTNNALDIARTSGARFIIASTSEVYGDPLEHPQKETYWGNVNPNGPRACYDESKRFGEMLTQVYMRTYDVDTRIIRIFNTYGPRMRPNDGRVVSNFINAALDHKPLVVYGSGKQTRSFCFVSDLVEGFLRVALANDIRGEVINLGNPEEYTVSQLADKIMALCPTKAGIEYAPLPQDDPQKRRPDISKAKKLLDWEPRVSVDEGLAQTVAYYRSIQSSRA